RGDLRRIAEAAVGVHAGDAAFHQPRHQDRAGRGGARVLAAVHHHYRTGWAVLDRLALRMAAVAEHVELVEVFARRDVTQGEGLADQRRLVGRQRMDVLDRLDAIAALEQGGRHGRRADGAELVAGLGLHGHSQYWRRQASRSSPASVRPVPASRMPAPSPASLTKKLGKVLRTHAGLRRRMPGTRKPSMPKHMATRWSL